MSALQDGRWLANQQITNYARQLEDDDDPATVDQLLNRLAERAEDAAPRYRTPRQAERFLEGYHDVWAAYWMARRAS